MAYAAGDRTDFSGSRTLRNGTVSSYVRTDLACADINTGVSVTGSHVIPNYQTCYQPRFNPNYNQACVAALPGQADVTYQLDEAKRAVESRMPLFEMQALLDTLYHYAQPATDLTEALRRIPLAANAGLCLDVSAGPGTQAKLGNCNGTGAQQFDYDRETKRIVNAAWGMCLRVRPFSATESIGVARKPGKSVGVSHCEDEYTPAQE